MAVVLACALAAAGPVGAKSHGCPKPRFLTGHRTTLRITCASEGRGGSSVTVTAIWPRNAALFIDFTNKSCATTHGKAKALIRSEGNEGFVFDELLRANGDRAGPPRSATSSSRRAERVQDNVRDGPCDERARSDGDAAVRKPGRRRTARQSKR